MSFKFYTSDALAYITIASFPGSPADLATGAESGVKTTKL